MNRRGARLVGEVATVSQAIEDGSGRIHYGDSEWLAKGAGHAGRRARADHRQRRGGAAGRTDRRR